MVGCIYKIIAKVLANRIKVAMPTLVGESQSIFVVGRQILDGTLIANEAVWWLKKSKSKGVLLKLDFYKAYDTIRWSFIDDLSNMTLGGKWTS